jgi:hypothetical protein
LNGISSTNFKKWEGTWRLLKIVRPIERMLTDRNSLAQNAEGANDLADPTVRRFTKPIKFVVGRHACGSVV